MLKTEVNSVFLKRRKELMEMDPGACFVFFGASEVVRNHDVMFRFRQESNFLYLTDFDEPDAVLVLVEGKSHLFVLERDLDREIWDGERYGLEGAKRVFQVDETYPVKEFYHQLEALLAPAKRLYYSLGEVSKRDAMMVSVLRRAAHYLGKGSNGKLPILAWEPLLSKMRVLKDEFDLKNIRQACSISARAHAFLLSEVRVGMTEFQASALFQNFIYQQGCTDLGYSPIFAGGKNATTLHYVRNNEILKSGDLLLVDAGGEVNAYTADITQTFPLASHFTEPQKKIYEAVRKTSQTLIASLKPGISYREVHRQAVELTIQQLLELEVLKGSVKENIESKAYRAFFPHGVGHYLGLDVHDAGIYDEQGIEVKLEAGMIMTIEPGLYFRNDPGEFQGIGVRIEDDVLLTATGCEVLTHELPREIEQIEGLREIANRSNSGSGKKA